MLFLCQCLWKSLVLLSRLIAVEQIDWFNVCGSKLGSRRCSLSEGKSVYLGPWGSTCEWVSIGYWSFSFMNKIEALFFCFLYCFSTELPGICLSFFGLQLSKKDLLISGGNKKTSASPVSFSNNDIGHNYFHLKVIFCISLQTF